MRFLLPFFFGFILIVGWSLLGYQLGTRSLKPQNVVELSFATQHDGSKNFYEQVGRGSGEWIENGGRPIFDNKHLAIVPQMYASHISAVVLGSHTASDSSEKWIEVDISDQKLYAWEGDRKVFEFSISSGRPGYDTVQGEFRVWRKVKYQTYRGGSKARGDYYYLPNVPYSLFFYKDYAIHGAYWHNDFGIQRRSSGCVNLRPEDAEKLFFWAGPAIPEGRSALNATSENPGVRVIVHK